MSEALPFVVAVIEDDKHLRAMLCAAFRRERYAVLEASTLADAERLLFEYPWDIAVLDRHLPGGDSLTLCEAIRRRDPSAHRYVLMLSGDSSSEAKRFGFDSGVDDYIGKPFDLAELVARVRAARRIVEYQKNILGRMAALEQMSVIDPLTQVYNRRFLEMELTRCVDLALRYGRPLSVAMIDIDHFKLTNDTHGHAIGDLVLVELSTMLIQNVRTADIVARYGGEEFALILMEAPLAEAVPIVDRLRECVENAVISSGAGPIRITISAGVATLPVVGFVDPAALLKAADDSLYEAKSAGRNVVVAHPEPDITPAQSAGG